MMNIMYQHWFSYGMIAIWLIIWLLLQQSDFLDHLCGRGWNLIGHQYYRFGTALLLHKDMLHLIANAIALYWVGVYLEHQISATKLCIFAMLVGTLSQLLFAAIYRNSTSFGGSPVIFGLIGLIVVWNMMKNGNTRFQLGTWYGNWIVGYAVLSNLPLLGNDLSILVIHGISLVMGMLFGAMTIGLRLF